MEADNIPQKPNMDEMDQKDVDQDGPRQEEITSLSNMIQVQPGDAIVVPQTLAHLPSRNQFHFLHLPAEVRNMVYQYGSTYVPYYFGHPSQSKPTLRQPPIARVNRQIRHECLHIFYEMFHFLFDLNMRSQDVAGEGRVILLPASEDQISFQSVHKTIQAFSPTPHNMLQMSNLRFLSRLTICITLKGQDEDLGRIAFHMTSADEIDFSSLVACGLTEDETNFASLVVRDLDWNVFDDVRTAWVSAAHDHAFDTESAFCGGWESNELGYFAHRALVGEIVSLLCLIAECCPQLTRNVSLVYEGPGLYAAELQDLCLDAGCLDYPLVQTFSAGHKTA